MRRSRGLRSELDSIHLILLTYDYFSKGSSSSNHHNNHNNNNGTSKRLKRLEFVPNPS